MNLHFMLILLSFVAPTHKDMELVPAPQVTAPMDIHEGYTPLQLSYKPYVYFGKDNRWHAVWSEWA